jgi:hypothetical protein
MTGSIDELFSPQRLRRMWNRQTWNQPADADGRKTSQEASAALPHRVTAEVDRLQGLVDRRLPVERAGIVDTMVQKLRELLNRCWLLEAEGAGDTGDGEESAKDLVSIRQSIEEILNQIEDLLESWGV